MIPDLSQMGHGQTQEWAPVEEAPHIMLDHVTKTYGSLIGSVSYTHLTLQTKLLV